MEPLLNRLLRFQAGDASEAYVEASAHLLQASSELHAPVRHISRQILDSLSEFLHIMVNSVITTKQPDGSLVSCSGSDFPDLIDRRTSQCSRPHLEHPVPLSDVLHRY